MPLWEDGRSPRGALTPPDVALRALTPAESELARLAIDLGALSTGGALSPAEQVIVERACTLRPTPADALERSRRLILEGADPLGESFCRLRSAIERRRLGAFYTQPALVEPMLRWALARDPARLVDAGCGSGRFAAGAARRRPGLALVAVDIDLLATLLTRATLSVLGARAALVLHADYATCDIPHIEGRTAFVGNPPYVRHHDLPALAKEWIISTGRRAGYTVSALAGLHAYFYLATLLHARRGDIGCFVTSAEWLDVNYGATIRELLLDGLGGLAIHVLDPRSIPFEDAMATAAIACFEVGSIQAPLRMRFVESARDLDDLDVGNEIRRDLLGRARRWTPFLRDPRQQERMGSWIPLGTLVRVHRGTVTGGNDFFVLSRQRAQEFGIEPWCRAAITSADEILRAGGVLRDSAERRVLLTVPGHLDRRAHPSLDAYLRLGEMERGGEPPIAQRYIPSHRNPWWYLGPSAGSAAPIVASYMARQPPAFALNPDGLALINIGHGLYPRRPLSPQQMAALVSYLNDVRESLRGSGRTYHGGLEKFEPRELEAVLIPSDGPLGARSDAAGRVHSYRGVTPGHGGRLCRTGSV